VAGVERSARVRSRSRRFADLAKLRTVSAIAAPTYCMTPMAAKVPVGIAPGYIAHGGGVQRCGSVWVCPACAPVVREKRAGEIDQAVRAWLDAGGGAAFVTLTVPHHQGDALAKLLCVVMDAYNHVGKSRDLIAFKNRTKFAGQIRAIEVTHGQNGWHPHLHALYLFERPLSADDCKLLEWYLFEAWANRVEAKGLGRPSREHGVDARPVTNAAEMAGYLTKVQGGWGAGLELARLDVKKGRSGHRSPWQLWREFMAEQDPEEAARWLKLWNEYEVATKSRRAIQWTPGLRKRLCAEPDRLDSELAAEEADTVEVTVLTDHKVWGEIIRAGTLGRYYADLEQAWALLCALRCWAGVEPMVIDLC
jgi:hypothetical protein